MDSQGMKELRLRIENEIEEEIQDAVRFAEESPFPAPETAMDYTYA
jgi:pyruvate dehydrogenase E1 component alpha subunit